MFHSKGSHSICKSFKTPASVLLSVGVVSMLSAPLTDRRGMTVAHVQMKC